MEKNIFLYSGLRSTGFGKRILSNRLRELGRLWTRKNNSCPYAFQELQQHKRPSPQYLPSWILNQFSILLCSRKIPTWSPNSGYKNELIGNCRIPFSDHHHSSSCHPSQLCRLDSDWLEFGQWKIHGASCWLLRDQPYPWTKCWQELRKNLRSNRLCHQ